MTKPLISFATLVADYLDCLRTARDIASEQGDAMPMIAVANAHFNMIKLLWPSRPDSVDEDLAKDAEKIAVDAFAMEARS